MKKLKTILFSHLNRWYNFQWISIFAPDSISSVFIFMTSLPKSIHFINVSSVIPKKKREKKMANLPSPTEVNIYFKIFFLSCNEFMLLPPFSLRKHWCDKRQLKFYCWSTTIWNDLMEMKTSIFFNISLYWQRCITGVVEIWFSFLFWSDWFGALC